VQLASYFDAESARLGWSILSRRHHMDLEDREHRLVEGTALGRKVVRVQVLTTSNAEASDLCGRIRKAGGDCLLPIG
jgi:hypothetical protein